MITYMLQLKITVMHLVTMIIMISGALLGGPGPGPRPAKNKAGRKKVVLHRKRLRLLWKGRGDC